MGDDVFSSDAGGHDYASFIVPSNGTLPSLSDLVFDVGCLGYRQLVRGMGSAHTHVYVCMRVGGEGACVMFGADSPGVGCLVGGGWGGPDRESGCKLAVSCELACVCVGGGDVCGVRCVVEVWTGTMLLASDCKAGY